MDVLSWDFEKNGGGFVCRKFFKVALTWTLPIFNQNDGNDMAIFGTSRQIARLPKA